MRRTRFEKPLTGDDHPKRIFIDWNIEELLLGEGHAREGNDREYVRADLFDNMAAELKLLREARAKVADGKNICADCESVLVRWT